MAPASSSPFEFNGLNLQQIAETLAEPFGVDVVFEADAGAPFRRVKMEPTDKPLGFLVELAQQRGLVITDTVNGDLLFKSTKNQRQIKGFTTSGGIERGLAVNQSDFFHMLSMQLFKLSYLNWAI